MTVSPIVVLAGVINMFCGSRLKCDRATGQLFCLGICFSRPWIGIGRFRQVYSKIQRTNVGRMDPMLWEARQLEGAPRNQCRFGPPDPNIAQTDPTRLDQT